MDINWWQKIQKYFDHVIEMTPSDRNRYLSLVCQDDVPMLSEINALLSAADEAGQHAFLDKQGDFQLLEVGDRLNRYQIIKLLGRGTMGEVYLAKNDQGEEVAVKCLPVIFGQDDNTLRRFHHTANLAMKLRHPGICQVFDVGETDNHIHYLVMQYCAGDDLAQRMLTLNGDVESAVLYIKNLLTALSEAHRLTIWHRDIKPTNIMFTDKDQIKIVDFGLAKDSITKLTVTGTQLGTPAYMAPEQWAGKGVDHRADLWAIGIIFYELIAGVRPFQGDTLVDMMRSICNDTAQSLVKLNTSAPIELDSIIRTALHKDKALRFQNADAFFNALDVFPCFRSL